MEKTHSTKVNMLALSSWISSILNPEKCLYMSLGEDSKSDLL